jgi:hypothetical protein
VATGATGTFLYRTITGTSAHLWIIDANDPLALETVTTIDLGSPTAGAVRVGNGLLYVVVAGGVAVYDAAVPSAPTYLTTIATAPLVGMDVDGTSLWAIGSRDLYGYDVTDPMAPSLISTTTAPQDTTSPGPTTTYLEAIWTLPEHPSTMLVRSRVTNAWYGTTSFIIQRVDIGNPASPVFGSTVISLGTDFEFGNGPISQVVTPSLVAGSADALDPNSGTAVLRTAPFPSGNSGALSLAYGSTGREVGFRAPSTVLWNANEGAGWALHEIDASNPALPVQNGLVPVPFVLAGLTELNDLYVTNVAGNQVGFDAAAPAFLVPIGDAPYASGSGIAVQGALVASLGSPSDPIGRLRFTDISDPAVPVALGSLALAGSVPNRVALEGTTAYVSRAGGFDIVDALDPMAPALLGSFTSGPSLHGFRVSGTTAHVATALGYLALDLTNPANPVQFASLPMSDPANDVDVWNGRPLVARDDAVGGALDMLTPPPGPSVQFTFPVNGSAEAVVARNGLAYVAADGLYVIQLPGGGVPPPPTLVSHLPLGQCVSMSLDGDVAYLATSSATFAVDVTDPASPVLLGGIVGHGAPVAAAAGQGVILTAGNSQAFQYPVANPPMATFPGACPATGVGAPAAAPSSFGLQAGPNPFRSGTRVRFSLPAQAVARLIVYDVSGRRVATLADGMRGAGNHAVSWTARGEDGRELPSGVYFLCLTAGSREESRRVVFLR